MLDEMGLRPYVRSHPGKLIVLDEIQKRADLFSELRGLIDERKSQGMDAGCFLLLWSSRSANQQDESLAGRLSRISLEPLDVLEIASDEPGRLERLWLRGGLPASFLADDEASSLQMRRDIIDSVIDGDIGEGRQRARPGKMHALCAFLAHGQGEAFNASKIAMRFDDADPRFVRRSTERLGELMVARLLRPYSSNLKKRMVKTPKFYYRDSGLLHQLLGITSAGMLEHHPMAGPSWEGFVIDNILRHVPQEVADQAVFLPHQQRHRGGFDHRASRWNVLGV